MEKKVCLNWRKNVSEWKKKCVWKEEKEDNEDKEEEEDKKDKEDKEEEKEKGEKVSVPL